MANIKITALPAYADPASTDVLPIVDVGADATKKVSIQDLLKNAGSGTAAAPGIAFDGESTGIYSPGADQLALSTGGTGRLFVDANGHVSIDFNTARSVGASGIGLVHVDSGSGARYTVVRNTDDAFGSILALGKSRGTSSGSNTIVSNGDTCGQIYFAGADGTDVLTRCAQISGEIDGVTSADNLPGRLVFHTNGGASTVTERVRIDSSGKLLVGTSSDSGGALLQVNGDRVRIATAKTPASASATGTAGEVCWDTNYIYVCTATNTWKRAALSTW